MFERILVPLDGSKISEMVVPYAVEIASLFNSTVVVAGVSESYGTQSLGEIRSYLEKQAGKINESLIKRRPADEVKASTPQVTFQSLAGDPASEIINYSAEIDSSLIILASRGASASSFWKIGNVADKVLRAATCPVLLVREQPDDSVISLKYILRKILVPLDGSKLSETALPPALGLAAATGAEIILFQVIEPVDFSGYDDLAPEVIEKYKAGFHSTARNYLEKIKKSYVNSYSNISIATGESPVAEHIIDYSEVNYCDLIVMSTNGRSGLGRWVFGSVTGKVLHAGKRPLIVVRPRVKQLNGNGR
ncbi:MAG: universal stress protein [Dehalococcoidales bacterium]|nr:universal stress protein [Dehalococcoidales bacterium]